jgi:hypothetical protein
MQAATEWAVFTPYRKTHSLKHEMTQYQYWKCQILTEKNTSSSSTILFACVIAKTSDIWIYIWWILNVLYVPA